MLHQPDCDEVLIAEALTDRGDLRGDGLRCFELTAEPVLQQSGEEQISALDAVTTSRSSNRSARANHPNAGARSPRKARLCPIQKAQRTAGSTSPELRCAWWAARARRVVAVPAEHVRGPRQQLEVVRRQFSCLVRASKRVLGVRPGSPLV